MADSTFVGTRDKNSPSNSVKVLTVDTKFVTELAWVTADLGTPQDIDIDWRGQVLFGDIWLAVQEIGDAPVATGDLDISYRPLAEDTTTGNLGVTQETGTIIESGADYDTSDSRLHSFYLNKWFITNGSDTLYIGGDGGRFTFSPASTDFVGTLRATITVR